MTMNAEGAKTWAKLTKITLENPLQLFSMDMFIVSLQYSLRLKEGEAKLQVTFTAQEADDLVNILKSGKLPASCTYS